MDNWVASENALEPFKSCTGNELAFIASPMDGEAGKLVDLVFFVGDKNFRGSRRDVHVFVG